MEKHGGVTFAEQTEKGKLYKDKGWLEQFFGVDGSHPEQTEAAHFTASEAGRAAGNGTQPSAAAAAEGNLGLGKTELR